MARPIVPPMRPSVASASPRSRYSRNGRRPLRVHSVPSSRDSTILGFSVDMFPSRLNRSIPAALVDYGRLPATIVASARTPGKHFAQASATTSAAHDGGPAKSAAAAREEDDGHESRAARALGALSFGALFLAALFRRARADRRCVRLAAGTGSLAQPADQ